MNNTKPCANCGYPLDESERAGMTEIAGEMHSDAIVKLTQRAEAAEAKLREAVESEQSRWQPIETAPKDGSWIVITSPESGVATGKWLSVIDTWVYGSGLRCKPTHWITLPTPPTSAADGEDG